VFRKVPRKLSELKMTAWSLRTQSLIVTAVSSEVPVEKYIPKFIEVEKKFEINDHETELK